MNKRDGSVVMIILWILAILVVFSLGIGRRAALNLKIARFQLDRLKVGYWAKSGVHKAILMLKEDADDPQTKDYDTPGACGVNLGAKLPEEVFGQTQPKAGDGFAVGYYNLSGEFIYGLRDEESRINLNGVGLLPEQNKRIFAELFKVKNIDQPEAIAAALISWTDPENNEQDLSKKEALRIPEELMLILESYFTKKGEDENTGRKDARAIFQQVEGLVTVYGEHKINVNTAQPEVLKAICRACAMNAADADTLVEKIIGLRNANPITAIEGMEAMAFTPEEKSIFEAIKGWLVCRSENYRIESIGTSGALRKTLALVYNRSTKKIIYWHEN